MYNDAHEAAWKRIVDFVHAQSKTKFCLQLRPCRPQGRDQADVGGHRRAAGAGRLADHLGFAAAVFSAQRGPARDDARDMDRVIADYVAATSAPIAPAST